MRVKIEPIVAVSAVNVVGADESNRIRSGVEDIVAGETVQIVGPALAAQDIVVGCAVEGVGIVVTNARDHAKSSHLTPLQAELAMVEGQRPLSRCCSHTLR